MTSGLHLEAQSGSEYRALNVVQPGGLDRQVRVVRRSWNARRVMVEHIPDAEKCDCRCRRNVERIIDVRIEIERARQTVLVHGYVSCR